MIYTVNTLHKALGNLIAKGHGRKRVCVNKASFQHNLEDDGAVILQLAGLGVQWVPLLDGDVGTKVNRDGTESGRWFVVLAGDSGANMSGELVSCDR